MGQHGRGSLGTVHTGPRFKRHIQQPHFGKEFGAKIQLSGGRLENYVSPPGTGDDYLRQRTIGGWKMWAGWRITQDLNIINLQSTGS